MQEEKRKRANKYKSKVDDWDDDVDEQLPFEKFQSEQGEMGSVSRLWEHTRIVPLALVVITTPATIVIPSRGRWCKTAYKTMQ